METFTEAKELVGNPQFQKQRDKSLQGLNDDMIDSPIVDIIRDLNYLPYCFTLQCCYGHFVYDGQSEPHNLDPLPNEGITTSVTYKIAYIAFCLDNSSPGRELFHLLKDIPAIDPDNIQFCSAEWFWNKQVNSYALQVEPDRFKRQDTAVIGFEEALSVEKVRNEIFGRLRELLETLSVM